MTDPQQQLPPFREGDRVRYVYAPWTEKGSVGVVEGVRPNGVVDVTWDDGKWAQYPNDGKWIAPEHGLEARVSSAHAVPGPLIGSGPALDRMLMDRAAAIAAGVEVLGPTLVNDCDCSVEGDPCGLCRAHDTYLAEHEGRLPSQRAATVEETWPPDWYDANNPPCRQCFDEGWATSKIHCTRHEDRLVACTCSQQSGTDPAWMHHKTCPLVHEDDRLGANVTPSTQSAQSNPEVSE